MHKNRSKHNFFSGETYDDEVQTKLGQEHGYNGDIMQESFQDRYNNLTLKSIFTLKYFVKISENSVNTFLLKTDDDSFINLEVLWILTKSRLLKESNDLIGYMQVSKHSMIRGL